MSNADWVKAMKALEAKVAAGKATPEEIQLLNNTAGVFNMGPHMPSFNKGGIVGLDYLTRRL